MINNPKTDGESGIQGNDVSCAVPVHRGPELPTSPSVTGRGSNQVPAESVGNGNHFLKDKISKLPFHKECQLPEDQEGVADFQGENQPINEEGIIIYNFSIYLSNDPL